MSNISWRTIEMSCWRATKYSSEFGIVPGRPQIEEFPRKRNEVGRILEQQAQTEAEPSLSYHIQAVPPAFADRAGEQHVAECGAKRNQLPRRHLDELDGVEQVERSHEEGRGS